eukprot:CAMPEP_0177687854 /NCGR_PEP_ID=MMETSP0447-20121125/34356_1 /TAXON_ID=0 /ORGANISM="Stygamoeba regulata, Strain BSH-02190019" /LENGTH=959 /DNA_ID=CAMNT_0019198135 /DNA_START=73 /DNA_END=2952 /DNA_ORIENTATION=-
MSSDHSPASGADFAPAAVVESNCSDNLSKASATGTLSLQPTLDPALSSSSEELSRGSRSTLITAASLEEIGEAISAEQINNNTRTRKYLGIKHVEYHVEEHSILLVTNLPLNLSPEHLAPFFQQIGVTPLKSYISYKVNQFQGSAAVQVASEEELLRCLELDGKLFRHRILGVGRHTVKNMQHCAPRKLLDESDVTPPADEVVARTLYLTGLPEDVTEGFILKLFQPIRLQAFNVLIHLTDDGIATGEARVRFSTTQDAEHALAMDFSKAKSVSRSRFRVQPCTPQQAVMLPLKAKVKVARAQVLQELRAERGLKRESKVIAKRNRATENHTENLVQDNQLKIQSQAMAAAAVTYTAINNLPESKEDVPPHGEKRSSAEFPPHRSSPEHQQRRRLNKQRDGEASERGRRFSDERRLNDERRRNGDDPAQQHQRRYPSEQRGGRGSDTGLRAWQGAHRTQDRRASASGEERQRRDGRGGFGHDNTNRDSRARARSPQLHDGRSAAFDRRTGGYASTLAQSSAFPPTSSRSPPRRRGYSPVRDRSSSFRRTPPQGRVQSPRRAARSPPSGRSSSGFPTAGSSSGFPTANSSAGFPTTAPPLSSGAYESRPQSGYHQGAAATSRPAPPNHHQQHHPSSTGGYPASAPHHPSTQYPSASPPTNTYSSGGPPSQYSSGGPPPQYSSGGPPPQYSSGGSPPQYPSVPPSGNYSSASAPPSSGNYSSAPPTGNYNSAPPSNHSAPLQGHYPGAAPPNNAFPSGLPPSAHYASAGPPPGHAPTGPPPAHYSGTPAYPPSNTANNPYGHHPPTHHSAYPSAPSSAAYSPPSSHPAVSDQASYSTGAPAPGAYLPPAQAASNGFATAPPPQRGFYSGPPPGSYSSGSAPSSYSSSSSSGSAAPSHSLSSSTAPSYSSTNRSSAASSSSTRRSSGGDPPRSQYSSARSRRDGHSDPPKRKRSPVNLANYI